MKLETTFIVGLAFAGVISSIIIGGNIQNENYRSGFADGVKSADTKTQRKDGCCNHAPTKERPALAPVPCISEDGDQGIPPKVAPGQPTLTPESKGDEPACEKRDVRQPSKISPERKRTDPECPGTKRKKANGRGGSWTSIVR